MKNTPKLDITHPELKNEFSSENSRTFEDLSFGSEYKASWICKKHGTYECAVFNKIRGRGCKKCANESTSKPETNNSFGDLFPESIKEYSHKNTITVYEFSAGSDKYLWWNCELGHEYRMQAKHKSSGIKCPFCANRKVLPGFNDLATFYPDLVLEWSDKNKKSAKEYTAGSSFRAIWECPNGHEWQTKIYHRTGVNSSCPKCRASKIQIQIAKEFGVDHDIPLEIRWGNGVRLVADVLIENKIVIEYDGAYWHKVRYEKDIEKSNLMLEAGYKVIRIREFPLESLGINNTSYFEIFSAWKKSGNQIPDLILNINQALLDA